MNINEYNELGKKTLFSRLDPIEARIKLLDLFQEFYSIDGEINVTDHGFTIQTADAFSEYRIESELTSDFI